MKMGTLCSGIGAPELAAGRFGWETLWCAESEKFPSAVLHHHFPSVPNLGDVTKLKGEGLERPDVVVFGSPCQSFSVAGKKAGLDDSRGIVTLDCLRIVGKLLPRWVVIENVPGLLSDDGGRTFGTILRILGQFGYGFAYRVLDSQQFGVPQRRRRVFIVGCLGNWRGALAVLFEQDSLSGYSPASEEEGERIANGTLSRSVCRSSGGDDPGSNKGTPLLFDNHPSDSRIVPCEDQAPTLTDRMGTGGNNTPLVGTFWDGGQTAQTIDTVVEKGQMMPEKSRFPAVLVPPVTHKPHGDNASREDSLVLHAFRKSKRAHSADDDEAWVEDGVANTVNTFDASNVRATELVIPALADPISCTEQKTYTHEGSNNFRLRNVIPAIDAKMNEKYGSNQWVDRGQFILGEDRQALSHKGFRVRRLTPRECERLQGFPDDFTLIPTGKKKKPAKDGPRYKALGNAMTVNVMEWIFKRLEAVNKLIGESGVTDVQTQEAGNHGAGDRQHDRKLDSGRMSLQRLRQEVPYPMDKGN